jgi:hypothetical protein
MVFATLELTAQALVTPARLDAWRALGNGRCLKTARDFQATVPPSLRLGGSPLHDPCAVAWLVRSGARHWINAATPRADGWEMLAFDWPFAAAVVVIRLPVSYPQQRLRAQTPYNIQ